MAARNMANTRIKFGCPARTDQSCETLLADDSGQPEQAGLGEQVIDEQATDDQRDRRIASSRCSSASAIVSRPI